jgi:signal transduction histidine kinase/DNA-binding response OmpR family regulator/ligand-binding sensor domain-containing protein
MVRISTKYILLIILLTTCFYSITAQDIRNIGQDEGLSNNQAYTVIQDRKGFVWVSTKQGIDRFDGTRVVNYSLPVKLLANSHIKLVVDKNQNLWAFTLHGDIFYFSYTVNKFILVKQLHATTYAVTFDSSNNLWLTTKLGLIKYEDNRFTIKMVDEFFVIIPNKDDYFFVADNNNVYSLNLSTFEKNKLTRIEESGLNTRMQNIVSLYYDSELNKIWIGTVSVGVYCYNIENKTLIDLKTKIKDFPNVPVWQIRSYNREFMCVTTDGSGIYIVNKLDLSLKNKIQENVNAANTIKGNGIYDVYVDNLGTLFAVSFTGGLNIIKTKNKYFEVIRQERNNANSLSNNVVRSIYEDRDGDLWFATYNGVNYLNRKTNRWKYFSDVKDNFYLSLAEDKSGNILAGSYSQGITIINKDKGIIGHVSPKSHDKELGTNFIMAILFDQRGNIWSGGFFGELSCYQPPNGKYHYINITDVNALENNDSTSILVASSEGAFIVDTRTFKVKEVRFSDKTIKKGTSLMFNTVAKIEENNQIWFGCEGEGLFCWDYDKRKAKRYTTNEGLPSDFVVSLLYDKDSLLWGGTNNGLFSINPKTSKIVSYSTNDGLSDNSFSRHSMCLTKNNELLFGTNNGVTKFSSKHNFSNSDKIKLYIDEFRIFNQTIVSNQQNSPLKDDIDVVKEIKLKWSQHSFSFSFGTIDLQNSKRVYYQWKLIGLDNDWNSSNDNTLASYTNVKPGKYTFVLKAVNRSDKNEIAEKKINIIVSPPFWETNWARFLFLLLLIFIIRTIYLFYRKKQIQQYSDEKIDFFTKTAHDIKTPLSLITAPLNELKKSVNLVDNEKYFINLAVSNVERLNTIVNQLMDFQKSETLKSQLVISSFDVVLFIKSKVEVFSMLALKQDVQILFTYDIDELEVWMDIEKFERIVDNLVSNAIKYTPASGTIEIHIGVEKDTWILIVKDNGIGISEKDQTKIFKHFYRGENAIDSNISGSGVGLLLTKNYILLHHGQINFQSKQGVGTTFTLLFKSGKSHYDANVLFSDKVSTEDTNKTVLQTQDDNYVMNDNQSTNEIKILLVEDNNDLRNFMQTILGGSFTIKSAINGREAFEIMNTFTPDLIISDVQMAEMDGLTFSSKIKGNFETSHIPIILLSALSQKDQILQGIQVGVDDYITKPFDIDLLIAKIHAILKNRELVRARFLSKLDDNKVVDVKTEIPNERDREFIEKALTLIQHNLSDYNFNKDILAREMAVSQSLLYSKIKHLSGEAPSDLIRIIRLKKSMELLKMNQYPISDVAFMCGFNDAKYFSTVFKKYFGKSPSEIKK